MFKSQGYSELAHSADPPDGMEVRCILPYKLYGEYHVVLYATPCGFRDIISLPPYIAATVLVMYKLIQSV